MGVSMTVPGKAPPDTHMVGGAVMEPAFPSPIPMAIRRLQVICRLQGVTGGRQGAKRLEW